MMFGKPHWFRPKRFGWGLVPIAWQGWLYTTGWSAAMVLPFLLLVVRHQALEAMAWLGLSLGALTFDVWQILRSYGGPSGSGMAAGKNDDNVLYIMDSRPGQPVATKNYNLQVRR
jgi:hypothetical protein